MPCYMVFSQGNRERPIKPREIGTSCANGVDSAGENSGRQRILHPLAFPALLVATVVLVHVVRLASGYSIEAAREAGWLLNVGRNSEIANPLMLLHAVQAVDLHTAALAGGEFIGLFAVTAITLLLGLVVVEVEGRLDVDLDRELRLNGLANILVGLGGGMVGTLSVSRTLVNLRAGGSSRASGVIAGVLCLAVLGFGTDVLIYFPVPVLAAFVHQGAVMLHEWLIRTRRAMPIAEYLQIIVIMLAIIHWNFLAGVAVGVVSACVTFAINTSRVRLVRQVVDRSSYRSRVDRTIAHQDVLAKYGSSIPIMWLHGFVFFGSAHRLLLDVKQIVETRGSNVCRSLILDFRQVLGIDSSASSISTSCGILLSGKDSRLQCRRYHPLLRKHCATAACSARRTRSEGCFPIWTPRWNGAKTI
jgi:sulfate permease, SulP family